MMDGHFWASAEPELPCPICGVVAWRHDPVLAEMGSWVIVGGERASVEDSVSPVLRRFLEAGVGEWFPGRTWFYAPSDRHTTAYSIWRIQRTRVNGQRGRGHHRPHRR